MNEKAVRAGQDSDWRSSVCDAISLHLSTFFFSFKRKTNFRHQMWVQPYSLALGLVWIFKFRLPSLIYATVQLGKKLPPPPKQDANQTGCLSQWEALFSKGNQRQRPSVCRVTQALSVFIQEIENHSNIYVVSSSRPDFNPFNLRLISVFSIKFENFHV